MKEKIAFTMPVEVELKFSSRFIVEFPKDFNISEFVVQKSETPTFNVDLECWENLKIEFIDIIVPSTSRALFNLIKEKKFSKFETTLKILDPTGLVVEKWKISDAQLKSLNFGSLDYSSDGFLTPSIVIGFSECELLDSVHK